VKPVHLVGLTTGIYYDARTHERHVYSPVLRPLCHVSYCHIHEEDHFFKQKILRVIALKYHRTKPRNQTFTSVVSEQTLN